MSTVVEIPGIGEVEFPGSMSEQEIAGAIQNMQPGQIIPQQRLRSDLRQELIPGVPGSEVSTEGSQSNPGALAALMRAGAGRVAGNVAGIPNVLANTVRRVPAQLGITGPTGALAATDQRSLGDLIAPNSRTVPSLSDPIIPSPSGEQIIAGAETAAQVPGAALQGQVDLSQMFGKNMADAQALAQEHPTATTFGGIFGDGLTLATGRLPMARAMTEIPRQLPRAIPLRADPSTRRTLDRFLHSPKSETFLRGIRRSAETGFEGAVLATLADADPAQTAIYGSVAQAVGSTALTTGNFMKRHPFASLGFAALVTAAGIQTFKSATPGGQDRILESIESGFDKTVGLAALAAVSGIAGAGRGRGSLIAEEMPRIIEGGTAFLRGSMLSILKDAGKEQDKGISTTEQTLTHLATNPDRFTDEQLSALERGFKKGNLSEVAQRLAAEDEGFADIIDSAPQPFSMQGVIRDSITADTSDANLMSTTRIAEAIADRIPEGIDRDKGPRTLISDLFRDEKTIATVLRRVGSRQRLDLLEANLDAMLTRAGKSDGPRRFIDGEAFRKQWNALPETAREAYSKSQQESIEAFISAAQSEPVSALPPLLARSLMLPDGQLARTLRGE